MIYYMDKNYTFPNQLITVQTSHHISSGLHLHNFFELLYVSSGKLYHSHNGKHTTLYPGDFLFIDLGDIHQYNTSDYNGKSVEVLNLMFLPQFIDKSISECKNMAELLKNPHFGLPRKQGIYKLSAEPMHDDNNEILSILLQLQSDTKITEFPASLIVYHKLIALLLLLLSPKYNGIIMNTAVSDITKQILQIISECYDKDNVMLIACQKLNYSISYLSNIFKRDTGIGFKEYLQRYRIDEAKKMLEYSDEKVSQIGKNVGYTDVKYFYNIFKKYTGVTPSEYRMICNTNKESINL